MSPQRTFLLGYDIGSSSIKAALIDARTHETIAIVHSPQEAMAIHSPQHGWAEQDPEMWWSHVCIATRELLRKTSIDPKDIKGIGIAYQMHGLVCVDNHKNVLRPAIIWCDSRAVEIGDQAFDAIGHDVCMQHLLNSPGNFTASKLKWVKDNEPDVYARIDKFMLPGDYIAMKLTGEIKTTPVGLSEGMLWDFVKHGVSDDVIEYFGFESEHIPDLTPVFSIQGQVNSVAANDTGLEVGTPVTYRAGDQPNNAMALGVLQPGEIAASGGTSGVVYGVVDKLISDPQQRVNSFAHVNHRADRPQESTILDLHRESSILDRIGILLCINGAGSHYNWIKQHIALSSMTFPHMEDAASKIPIGSDGLTVLPFGNGVERMLGNHDIGAHILHLDFNRHTRANLYRASLEGIAFAFVYGVQMMQEVGLEVNVIKVANDNLFQSEIFSVTIATLLDCRLDVIDTTGAVGAAHASGVATGIYTSLDEATQHVRVIKSYHPTSNPTRYLDAFHSWKNDLSILMDKKVM